ncbi:helix-turn-helix domain-containing protein [Mesorhizobium sp. MSK_1335]|uniref:Helix-turn-helix domain-containing protein n=1 Tax=Mesorhizobium montanum TaxID=3072323 RepID=A0ABU4ZG33_9HYPH|nr:helix-turn-helix domain-containing protein [Mesorhizobium sp. MSK_1335]MDX8523018.1 helix-turn-helix domain-containing protein [Mesorhizobium sp. MSK_1335]
MLVKVDRLSAGALPSRIRQVQSHGRWAIDFAEFNCALRASGGLDPGSVVLLAVKRASESTICGIQLKDDMILTIPGGTTVTAMIQPGLSYTGAVVPTAIWAEIQAAAAGLIVEQAADRPDAIRLATSDAQTIQSMIEQMADGFAAVASNPAQLERPPVALIEYLGALAEARAVSAEGDKGIAGLGSRHLRQACAAEEFIHAHIGEEIPVIRLCKEIGVSRRQLEYAFRATFAVSPQEFIRTLRLNEARRQLTIARAHGLSVTRVAMEVGITHLGRFAANYRLLFGESPKETFHRTGTA